MEDLDNVLESLGIHFAPNEPIETPQEAQEQDPQPTEEAISEDHPSDALSDSDTNEILSRYLPPQNEASEGSELSENSENFQQSTTSESSENSEFSPQSEASNLKSQFSMLNAQIPPNSPTLLLDESTSRFSGAEWYSEIQKAKIIIGGMGGISSHLAFNLARMSPSALVMYDDDVVETANMSGQLYSREDVGTAKVEAIESMVRKYANVGNIYAIKQKFTANSEAGNIMMCGFDNMLARSLFFSKWQYHVSSLPEKERAKCLFLDGRLSLSVMQIFCITGIDEYNMRRYKEQFLFSDSEAEPTVCSMKQTTYLASIIGATMVNLFTNFVANTLNPLIPYALPFFTEYDAQYMIFKTVN